MPPAGFEPTILVSELPKTHVLDRAATAIGEGYTLYDHKTNEQLRDQLNVYNSHKMIMDYRRK
jgi:hypothetical protein